jgi:hypothetical protein
LIQQKGFRQRMLLKGISVIALFNFLYPSVKNARILSKFYNAAEK